MKIELILDSGAFSAWTKKSSVCIQDYAAYIKDNCEHFDYCVNLDRIPGEFGRVPSPEEVEASADESWRNYLWLEDFGIRTKPVFHQGEQFKWLDKMIDHGIPYIGISPANDRTTAQKRVWLDQVFTRICDASGRPRIRTHGFGVTSIPLLARYPWYSADSTSWMMMGAYGKILVPQWDDAGQWQYSKKPHLVSMSNGSSDVNDEGKHFNTFPKASQAHIVEYMDSLGVSVTQAQDSYYHRAIINASFFKRFSERHVIEPFLPKRVGFIDRANNEALRFTSSESWDHIKLIFAVGLARQHSTILTELGIERRLLSYYYLKEGPADFLPVYMRDGVYTSAKSKKARRKLALG